MSERPYILQDSGAAFPAGDLVDALDEFAAEERYSSRRDQILREIRDRPFLATILFQASDRTYGYTTDDRFRDGQTLDATLEGSSHRLSLQMPATLNEKLHNSRENDPIRVNLLITKWNSVSAAFEGQCALDLLDTPAPADVQEPERDRSSKNQDAPSSTAPSGEEAETAPDPPEEAISSETPVDPVIEEHPDLAIDRDTPVPLPPPLAEDTPDPPRAESAYEDLAEHKRALKSLHLELTTGTTPLAASSLAKYIGLKSGIDVDVVERLISSFWSYYLTPFRFMEGRLVVNVPLVGSFTLYRKSGGSPGVTLKQVDADILAAAHKTIHSMRDIDWIEDYHAEATIPDAEGNDVAGVAVSLAEEHNIDLRTSYTIVLELLALVTTLISIGTRRIRWPEIGEMYPASGPQGGTTYRFRVYKNLLRALSSVPLEKYADLVVSPGEEESLHIRPGHKKKNSSSSTSGCLLVFVAILFFVFVMNDGCRTIRRAFGSTPPVLQQQDFDDRPQDQLRPLARRHPNQVSVRTGFNGIPFRPLPGTSWEPR